MTKDEEQLIANIMHRMHVNEQARLDAALASARADAVARAEADRVRIEGLSEELRLERETCTETADLLNRESEKVRGLSVQAQDQRSEIERLRDEAAKYKTERDHFYQREGIEAKKPMDVEDERDALRAEVAALQARLRSSIARGDFAQMEVAALKSQTPNPVKVGEWVKAPLGTRGKVVSLGVDYLEVELTNGPPTRWWPVYMCEPCDQPATHDTEAGKATAEAVIREISLKDVRKVTT